ncbi:CPBP family glutamic-type intramembrane protease [Mammaliicoccus lentus]
MGNLVFNSGAEDMIVEKASFINLLGGISYGGIIEELITRFGLMTFITFMLIKIFKRKTTFIYIISIILSAVIFSLGHLPSALVGIDEHYFIIILKVITLNTFAGTVYGFLYYKYYLESAMLAHVFYTYDNANFIFIFI